MVAFYIKYNSMAKHVVQEINYRIASLNASETNLRIENFERKHANYAQNFLFGPVLND
jgi:hypothetical protein